MSHSHDPRINAFFDGQLDPSEREAFLDLLEEDAKLREVVERQRDIDASLKRTFEEDRLAGLLGRVEAAITNEGAAVHATQHAGRGWRGLAAAALVVISLTVAWYSWSITRPQPAVDVYQPQPWRSMATVYAETLRDGFKPAWICRNERQFERAFTRRFRQPLLLAALPAGTTAGGISYSNTISEATINVLGKVDGTPVMVFVDKVDVDLNPPPPPPPELHLFRREIDDLVLYELTPLHHPSVLPYFYHPAKE